MYSYIYDSEWKNFTKAVGVGPGWLDEISEDSTWLNWEGHWGDQQYPESDPRQECLAVRGSSECRYVSGPTGPITKNLNREAVCEDEENCVIKGAR